MTEYHQIFIPSAIEKIPHFPFDIVAMTGNDSVDFLHRISTQSFSQFTPGEIRKTLFITEKGRLIDAAWVVHRTDHLCLLVSKGMAVEICEWLGKFIIMEDIVLNDITERYTVTLDFSSSSNAGGVASEYFTIPASFTIHPAHVPADSTPPSEFEYWRIWNGIPKSKKELIHDYNPLELRLNDWISFTKGCYIGQEVIARLDTYKKVQRALYRCVSEACIQENDILLNRDGKEIGKITSTCERQGGWIALAMLKTTSPEISHTVYTAQSNVPIHCEPSSKNLIYARN